MQPDEFVSAVTHSYINHLGIFKIHKNAEDLAPGGSPTFRALFLFYVIQLDYATKSQRLYDGAKRLAVDNPGFYSSQQILKIDDAELAKILIEYLHPRYINEAILRYKTNSQVLVTLYAGNPLNIFKKASTVSEVQTRIREFRGFGPKIGNFFIRTMINTFNFEYPDIVNMLPPVDIHDVRIAHLMGFIDSDAMTQKNITRTKVLWNEACRKAGVSWLEFDKALWLLGSEGRPTSKNEIMDLLR